MLAKLQISIFSKNERSHFWSATGVAFLIAIASMFCLSAEAADTLTDKQKAALAPLTCEACIELRKLVAYRGVGFQDVLKRTGKFWRKDLYSGSKGAATEEDVSANPRLPTVLTAPDGVKAAINVVCVGAKRMDVPIETASGDDNGTSFTPNPNIQGVCIGDLQNLEVFLRSIVNTMYMEQLEKYETAVSKTAIENAIKTSLQSVIFEHQTKWAEKVKADVLSEMDKTASTKSQTTPKPNDGEAQVCISGVTASCDTKRPTSVCCRCLETDGIRKEGICTSGSWKPKPISTPK